MVTLQIAYHGMETLMTKILIMSLVHTPGACDVLIEIKSHITCHDTKFEFGVKLIVLVMTTTMWYLII